jgi:hypothetical protein
MFSDTAIQLQPVFAQWIQNTHALAPAFSEALKFFSSPIAGIFAGDVIFPRLFWEVNFFFF